MNRTVLGLVALLAATFATHALGKPAQAINNPASDEFAVAVVSSAPQQVTGGDARLHIQVPRTVPLH